METLIKNKYLLALLILSITLNINATVPQIERDALVAIYNSTNGDQWYHNGGWLDGDPCDNGWNGVGCKNNLITRLVIVQNEMSGSLPPEIGNLNNLLELEISYNTSSLGTIPPEIGLLTNLKILNFSGGGFEGEIPIELGDLSNLEKLVLNDNDFNVNGSIPKQFFNLINLKKLQLRRINLSGSIPLEITKLSELRELWINSNQLTGNIPAEITNLSHLESLKLNDNQLIGSIPSTLSNLTNLLFIDLSRNQLSGVIPPELSNLLNLRSINLSYNQLSGTIPPEFNKLQELRGLNLSRNNFTGSFPLELINLQNLKVLDIIGNGFTGKIPAELASMSQLTTLNLDMNSFTGNIPKELGLLSNLTILGISGNRLTGSIPPQLGNLTNLIFFFLGYNQITGQIPVEITGLQMLHVFDASFNGFSGSIPIELMDMPNINSIYVDHNALYTDNEILNEFVDDKCDCDWSISQTIAPKNIQVFSNNDTSISVTWDAIDYLLYGGGYQILLSTIENGSYSLISETMAKTVTAFTVGNLDPNQNYFVKLKSFTSPVSPFQSSMIISEDSTIVMATTNNNSLSEVDLRMTIISPNTDDFIQPNDLIDYKIIISNTGSDTAIDAGFRHVAPTGLGSVSWTCGNATNGTVCPNANGNNNIDMLVTLPTNSSMEITLTGRVISNFSPYLLLLTATITPPNGANDNDLNNNIGFLNLRNVLFKNGFE